LILSEKGFGTTWLLMLIGLDLLIVAYVFYLNREMISLTLRALETKAYGRPLDKKLWTDEERKTFHKDYKLKFGWKDKKPKELK
jgi:hypothetical protein